MRSTEESRSSGDCSAVLGGKAGDGRRLVCAVCLVWPVCICSLSHPAISTDGAKWIPVGDLRRSWKDGSSAGSAEESGDALALGQLAMIN